MRAVLGVTVQSSKRLRKLSFEGKHQGTSGKGGGSVCVNLGSVSIWALSVKSIL